MAIKNTSHNDKNFGFDLNELRSSIQYEYEGVALRPEEGFHFHTGRKLTGLVRYQDDWLEGIPESAIESFAGTGNPFSLGEIQPGEQVVDVGSGAGLDSLIAARMASPSGHVIGIDMTPAMLEKARRSAESAHLDNVTFRHGYGEDLPIDDGWADVVISNGVLNLMPDKETGLKEMARVLGPSGRIQIGDILVQKEVPDSAKRDISLWSG